jgi:hypothetical protein
MKYFVVVLAVLSLSYRILGFPLSHFFVFMQVPPRLALVLTQPAELRRMVQEVP